MIPDQATVSSDTRRRVHTLLSADSLQGYPHFNIHNVYPRSICLQMPGIKLHIMLRGPNSLVAEGSRVHPSLEWQCPPMLAGRFSGSGTDRQPPPQRAVAHPEPAASACPRQAQAGQWHGQATQQVLHHACFRSWPGLAHQSLQGRKKKQGCSLEGDDCTQAPGSSMPSGSNSLSVYALCKCCCISWDTRC